MLELELCKHKYSSGECVKISLESIAYQTWLHFCFVYTQKRIGTNFHTKAKAYYNGDLIKTSKYISSLKYPFQTSL